MHLRPFFDLPSSVFAISRQHERRPFESQLASSAEILEDRCLLSIGTPLPQRTGEVFVVDDWDNKITPTDLGFNYFSGNTGATETAEGITTLDVSSASNGSMGGSLQISVDFITTVRL